MSIYEINKILAWIITAICFMLFMVTLYGGYIIYREYVNGKAKANIVTHIFPIVVFLIQILSAASSAYFDNENIAVLSPWYMCAINFCALAIFIVFVATKRLEFVTNVKSYIIMFIASRKILPDHIIVSVLSIILTLNMINSWQKANLFAITFNGESRNSHIYFSGNFEIKFNNLTGGVSKIGGEKYGILLNIENYERFPLELDVKTVVFDKNVTIKSPEDFDKYSKTENLFRYSYEDSVLKYGSTQFPLFLSYNNLLNALYQRETFKNFDSNKIPKLFAITKLQIIRRDNVNVRDTYYINSHIDQAAKTISIADVELLIPVSFREGVSIVPEVIAHRADGKQTVEIGNFSEILHYRCEKVASPVELLLAEVNLRADMSKSIAKKFSKDQLYPGWISRDCIYTIKDDNKTAQFVFYNLTKGE